MNLTKHLRNLSDKIGPDQSWDDYAHTALDLQSLRELENFAHASTILLQEMGFHNTLLMAIFVGYEAGKEDGRAQAPTDAPSGRWDPTG